MMYYVYLIAALMAVACAVLSVVYSWITAPAEGALVTVLWLMLAAFYTFGDSNSRKNED